MSKSKSKPFLVSKQRRLQLEMLENRRLLTASGENAPVSLNTIHQYGTALFGLDWSSHVGLDARQIQQQIDDESWRSMLNDSPAETISRIREEARYLGAEVLQAQVDQALDSANLTSIDITELDWLQEWLPGPAPQFDYFADGQGSDDGTSEGESDPPLAYIKYQAYSAYEGNLITPGLHGVVTIQIGFQGELPDGGFTVPWQATGQTATAGVDFAPTSGSVTFTDGAEGEKNVPFLIFNDTIDEPDETFKVTLQWPSVEGKGETTVTIFENDLHVSIFDADPVTEGDVPFVWPPTDQPTARFRVTISSPRSNHISIPWRVVPVEAPLHPATPGSDFYLSTTNHPNINGWLTFEPGETEKFVTFSIIGDRLYELTEHFHVDIASEWLHHVLFTVDNERGLGTIIDNDPFPELSVDDVSVEEHAGTATLTVTMTNRSSFPVSFNWAVADQTAIHPDDYGRPAASGTTNIPAGGGPDPHLEQFVFTIVNDNLTEPDETFRLTISNAVNANITKANGIVTILANDPQVDIDVDSNNNGAITETDDPIEMNAPGKVIQLNRDDDNGNGVPDYNDVGPLAFPDDELEPVNLAFVQDGLPQAELAQLVVRLTYSSNVIQVWDTQTKNHRIASERWWTIDQFNQLPATLFMEGIANGQGSLTLSLHRLEGDMSTIVLPEFGLETLVHFDTVLVTVTYVDLTGYTPYTEPFQLRPIPEANEETPGVHIRRNGDFDNPNNALRDWGATNYEGEDDLIRVDIGTGLSFAGLRYELERGSDDIRVWTSRNKVTQLVGTNNPGPITLDSNITTIWVEWVTPGTGPATSSLDIRLIDNVSNNVVATDTLVFHPFRNVTIVWLGEFQNPADPPNDPSNEGMMLWAIEQYAAGYNVYAFEERDAIGANAIYPAHDVVRNAVNNQGITSVALVGYSHGGGTVWMEADHLTNGQHGITNPFEIQFTGFIDAISQNGWWLGGTPGTLGSVDDRPPGSQFHVNQYQRNWLPPLWGDNSDGDDDIDRSYLGVNHSTIDDHQIVLSFLTMRYRQKVVNR